VHGLGDGQSPALETVLLPKSPLPVVVVARLSEETWKSQMSVRATNALDQFGNEGNTDQYY
jgi:hypothetical protein